MRAVFLGFYHDPRDPRLFHREMRALRAADPSVQLFFMTRSTLYYIPPAPDATPQPYVYFEGRSRLPRLKQLRRLRPHVLQASDARELVWAVLLRAVTGARLVYDAHEDYFNQIFEYSGKTLTAFWKAAKVSLLELALVRMFDHVYCTDDYLRQKYTAARYGAPSVGLLRNFPPLDAITTPSTYPTKACLDLVYIGGINRYRGVTECARYVQRFNARCAPTRSLTLTLYSPSGPLVDELADGTSIHHRPWCDYSQLIQHLPTYDVGICLWQRLKKFERNLPLKNFDYMAAGLPIITSNFGNLRSYAERSGGALCIDPLDYGQFENAIFELFDPSVRRRLGESGRLFVRYNATFESEASEYLSSLLDSQ